LTSTIESLNDRVDNPVRIELLGGQSGDPGTVEFMTVFNRLDAIGER
jgi:hypothetical protein